MPPDYVALYADQAAAAGDSVTLTVLPNAGHFEVIIPDTIAWPAVLQAIAVMLG